MKFHMMAMIAGGIVLGCVTSSKAEPVQGFTNPTVFQDSFVGEKTAPVTLVVYSSPTCGHCIDFHVQEMPKLKEKFVKSGKLKITYRPFVRNSVDAVIFMLANARGQDRFDEIAAASSAEDALRGIAESMGIDRAGFDRAVADQAYLDKLNVAAQRACDSERSTRPVAGGWGCQ